MRLYLCVHCQNDQHQNCERTIHCPEGQYGGSKCTCPCDGRKDYRRKIEVDMWDQDVGSDGTVSNAVRRYTSQWGLPPDIST